MNYGGDAAEQIVRMSLDGVEVAAKITGNGAKHLAIALMAILKEEKKTTGKARLTNMLRSGKQLNVFSLSEKDLKKFTAEAKKYGVLYCVVKSKHQVGDSTMIDLIVRAEDAPKINRIVENFKLATVDKASILSEVAKAKEAKKAQEQAEVNGEDKEAVKEKVSEQKGKDEKSNPQRAKTEKSPLSEPGSTRAEQNKVGITREKKASVREQLNAYKEAERKNDKNRNAQKSKTANQKQNTKQHSNKRKKKGKSR